MNFLDVDFKLELETKFEKIIIAKYPILQPVDKWKQIMWHKEGNLIVSLMFSTKKLKFCFFNNPNIKLDKLQRWSTTIYSQNLEITDESKIDWNIIEELTNDTIKNYS